MGDQQPVVKSSNRTAPASHQRAHPLRSSRSLVASSAADDLSTAAELAIHAVAQRLAIAPATRAAADYRRLLNRPNRGVAGPVAAPVVQRRGENPHAKGGQHEGWELTDHHIIAHSKLVTALAKLTDDQKKKVLVAVIPDVLTKEMMANVKVPVDDKDPEADLQMIRKQLVDPEFTGEIKNVRVDNIRESFFEWMGGNQFAGPNTSIRTEPSANKDDIDTDGRFFTKANYPALKGKADTLYSQLNTHKSLESKAETLKKDRNEGRVDEVGEGLNKSQIEESQKALTTVLLQIARIAKNVTPQAFDPTQWFEIKTPAKLELLATNGVLDRAHITAYAHFKMKAPATMGVFPEPYQALKAVNSGVSEFDFGDVKKLTSRVGAGFVYFPYETSRNDRPTGFVVSTVREALGKIAGTAGRGFDDIAKLADGQYTLDLPAESYALHGNQIKLKGYENTIANTGKAPEVKIAAGTLDGTMREKVPGQSLHDYLIERKTAVSSWLPKALHPALTLKMPAAIEEDLQRALRKEWRWAGLLAGAQKQTPGPRTQKTISLRMRQLAEAKEAVKTAREQLAQAKDFWGKD